MRKIQTDKYQ